MNLKINIENNSESGSGSLRELILEKLSQLTTKGFFFKTGEREIAFSYNANNDCHTLLVALIILWSKNKNLSYVRLGAAGQNSEPMAGEIVLYSEDEFSLFEFLDKIEKGMTVTIA